MSESISENKVFSRIHIIRLALIALSVILLVSSVAVYGVFRKETEIDANFTTQYLKDNDIDAKDFYGTPRFQEIESAIQAKRDAYWHRMYILPVVLAALALAAGALAAVMAVKSGLTAGAAAGSGMAALSGLYMFIVSLARLVSTDFKYLYFTSESAGWLGAGTAGWVFFALAVVALALDIVLLIRGRGAGKTAKTQAEI